MLTVVLAGVLSVVQVAKAPKIVHVSVFRNGYAFITREVDVSKSGEVEIDSVPGSTYGTLWFASTGGVKIEQITNGSVTMPTTHSANTVDDLLRLNVGHLVTLELRDEATARGTLRASDGEMVILTEAVGERVILKSQIVGMTSATPLNITTTSTQTARALRVRLEVSKPGKLYFVSLESGLGWDSAYLAEMTENKLTLTMRATIIDDIGDINGVDILMATLAPSGDALSTLETLISGQTIGWTPPVGGTRLVGGQGLVGESINFVSYDPTDNSLVVRGDEGKSADPAQRPVWASATGLDGAKHDDQFFYRQPNVQLKAGERGQFVLYQKEIPYEDLYTATVQVSPNQPRSVPVQQQVWHSVKFTNHTGQPLTAGALSMVSDGQFVGQSSLAYTAVGADAKYLVGSAPDVQAEASEEEASRARGARNLLDRPYDRVTVRGNVLLTNTTGKKVAMELTRTISGDLTKRSREAEVHRHIDRQDGLNAEMTLLWKVELEPKGKTTISYEYTTYVPE